MRKVLIAVLFMSVAVVAFGQAPGAVPFSADMAMKMKDGKNLSGKVYFSGTKLRQEMMTNGQQVIQIIDLKREVSDMLMPQQKMYMEMSYSDALKQRRGPKMPDLKAYDPNNPCAQSPDMTCERAGSETVNGRATEKWIFKNKKNAYAFTTWVDQKIHYPIRTASDEFEMNLTNVQEGMPTASLFEIPAGYRKFDLSGMMGGQSQAPDSE